MITLDKLNYLVTLAEERNVTNAAKRLYISQPTLTAFVNKQEQLLGVKLFDRSVTPIVLTKEGKAYIKKMQTLLLEEQELVEQLHKMSKEQKHLRIGIGQIHSEMWIPRLTKKLLEEFPDMDISIFEGREMEILENLRKDKLDIVFGHASMDTANFVYEEITTEKLLIVIPENIIPEGVLKKYYSQFQNSSPENPLYIDPSWLSTLPAIEPASSQGLYLNFKQLASSYHIHPCRIIRTSNMITATSMLKKGLGYMYLSPVLLTLSSVPSDQKLYYCMLPKLRDARSYYAIYKKKCPNIQQVQSAIKMIKEVIQEEAL